LIRNTAKGPFHVVGHSFGGNVAFEMALQCSKTRSELKTISFLNGSEELMKTLNEEDSQSRDGVVEALCKFVEQFVSDDAFKAKVSCNRVILLNLSPVSFH
ncbi:fatty acid synthase, partial [Nephila pilipes]